ncbi:MAG: hypothetical protein ACKPKO_49585, partial [Candidatus Fonsibacter sp.]
MDFGIFVEYIVKYGLIPSSLGNNSKLTWNYSGVSLELIPSELGISPYFTIYSTKNLKKPS